MSVAQSVLCCRVVSICNARFNTKKCEFYPSIVFKCPVWFLPQTATVPLYSILKLVFRVEANRVLCEVRSASSLLRELTVVIKRWMQLSRLTWLWIMNGELEGRRSWLVLVHNHSACLGTPKTMKLSRFESKPVLLTYTRTRTYLLRSRYMICVSTGNHCPLLTVRHRCTPLEFRRWSLAFKETTRVSYRRIHGKPVEWYVGKQRSSLHTARSSIVNPKCRTFATGLWTWT
jgi:hypothetical protein